MKTIDVNFERISESLGIDSMGFGIVTYEIEYDGSPIVPWNKGLKTGPLSNETREKMRQANLGKKLSEDHKRKIGSSNSISKKGQEAHNKGKSLSKEKRSKINKKTSYVVRPDGKVDKVTNMSLYCEENDLSPSAMCLLVNGKRKSHKGYKVK